jgi:hypothetical protein
MPFSKQKVTVALAFLLSIAYLVPVRAIEFNPGVSVGQYVVFGHWEAVNTVVTAAMNWEKIEVVAVSGTEVRFLVSGQLKNGTAMPHNGDTYFINVETGTTNETHSNLKSIIPASLNEGDLIPPGTFKVNNTEIRNYLGVNRAVNIVIDTTSDARVTVAYDKVSGMALQWESWMTQPNGVQMAIKYDITDTNIFEVRQPTESIPMVVYYALGAVAVVLPITAVVVFRRRKPNAKAEVLGQKGTDLTYNPGGINRGESYLSNSLPQCLRMISDLQSQGVRGLSIIRENPESVVKQYGIQPTDILLLSASPIKGFKAVSNLQEISIAIMKFLKSGGGVVLLDGLTYLISRFGFNTVYMCLQETKIKFLETGATLLTTVNMETLDGKEKALLLSELKLL